MIQRFHLHWRLWGLIGMIFSGGLPNAFQRITEISKLSELNGGEIFAALLVGLLYCANFLSIVSFMWAIIARVKNMNNVPSLFFFGSIGAIELQNYRDKANYITEQEIRLLSQSKFIII